MSHTQHWLTDCLFLNTEQLCLLPNTDKHWVAMSLTWLKLGQYHGCWCPGSLHRQDISSNDIDCVEYVGPGLTWERILGICVISMWSIDIKYKYMLILASKELTIVILSVSQQWMTVWQRWLTMSLNQHWWTLSAHVSDSTLMNTECLCLLPSVSIRFVSSHSQSRLISLLLPATDTAESQNGGTCYINSYTACTVKPLA